MLKIQSNYSLKNNTTFGVDIACNWFAEPKNLAEIEFVTHHAKEQAWTTAVIGEGSNLLFIHPFKGLIIHPIIKGIEKVDESDSEVLLRVGAGENWDDFVAYCVNNNWYGTENLSLIPGSVGAAPVQNIGAYGVEARDIIEYVEAFDTAEMKLEVFSNTSCQFAYRDSIFKHAQKDRYIVAHVVFRLKKTGALILHYGNVKEKFLKEEDQNLLGLRKTIISIRESKLPDPEYYGNAGSYFKNPIIDNELFLLLKSKYGVMPAYPSGKGNFKIPAAWLIENAEWKGVREGDVGTWPQQPLVIVNYGNASGEEIFLFSEKIRESVKEKFGVALEHEVTIISPSPRLLVS